MRQMILLLSFNSVTQGDVLCKKCVLLNFYVERGKCITDYTDKKK